MPARDKRVDAYIANSAEFARPILTYLRDVIHRGCPGVREEMKWSRPAFAYDGKILCGFAAFKEHCSFMFWGAEISELLRAEGVVQDGAMGTFGRITSLSDLHSEKKLLTWVKRAAAFVDDGNGESVMAASRRRVKPAKPPIVPPPEFAAALKKNSVATKVFDAFSPSCKREYVEWIAEAKRPETRERRITQAIAWIAEGKQRNWKYQNC